VVIFAAKDGLSLTHALEQFPTGVVLVQCAHHLRTHTQILVRFQGVVARMFQVGLEVTRVCARDVMLGITAETVIAIVKGVLLEHRRRQELVHVLRQAHLIRLVHLLQGKCVGTVYALRACLNVKLALERRLRVVIH
jgi:hypothetical protein